MKRLLNSTAALSVALMNIHPWPLMAQSLTDTGAVIAADGTILCTPSADAACDPNDPDLIAQSEKIDAQIAKAAADAQAKADAEAAAAADAQAKADAEAAAADAQAKADADAAAAADAQAKADAEAAAADAQAKADAEAAAADAQAKADADAAAADAQAKADADAAAADAQAKADAEAAAADAQAKADAEAAAADAQAKADAEAAAADAQAKADAEAAAADAQAKADAEAAAADAQAKADADATAADAQAKADAEAAAADAQAKADAEAAAAADAQADADATAADAQAKADAEAAAADAQADADATAADAQAKADAEAAAAALAKAEDELGVKEDGLVSDASAGLKTADEVIDPNAAPVAAPEVTDAEIKSLADLLAGETTITGEQAPATALPLASADKAATAEPSSAAVTTTSETVTDETTRSATQEFAAVPQVVAPGKKNKLSDLEKAGLVVLGALVVGTVINANKNAATAQQQQPQQQQVVSNTGDRVVVLQPDGSYQVYKDDNALLRRPGNTLRTETYSDGSTLTTVDRPDGSQIVTVRNATGRVLSRTHYDSQGRERMLINDLEPERPIIVSTLPKPKSRPVIISPQDTDFAIKAALAKRQAENLGRSFSLRQVRSIPQVRHLAALISVKDITFSSGSSALSPSKVDALADLGEMMQDMLASNPGEMFLIEGHTDAVGKSAMNLALSDRRAETIALALTQYFDIPPENLVVQGYGETELLIETQADEARNRRVAVRIITPLL